MTTVATHASTARSVSSPAPTPRSIRTVSYGTTGRSPSNRTTSWVASRSSVSATAARCRLRHARRFLVGDEPEQCHRLGREHREQRLRVGKREPTRMVVFVSCRVRLSTRRPFLVRFRVRERRRHRVTRSPFDVCERSDRHQKCVAVHPITRPTGRPVDHHTLARRDSQQLRLRGRHPFGSH